MRWTSIQQDDDLHVWVALPNLLQESQCSFLGSALRQTKMSLASHWIGPTSYHNLTLIIMGLLPFFAQILVSVGTILKVASSMKMRMISPRMALFMNAAMSC